MVSVEYSQAIVEVLDILKHSDEEILKKIPESLIKFWEENKSTTYIPNLDHSKAIDDMQLKNKTRAILAMIYMKYLCDEKEREELEAKLKQNEQELQEKYNPNVFANVANQNNKKVEEEADAKKQVAMVEYKESVFKRIINKIKNFLKKIKI